MRTGELASMGGGGGFVEADETFIGREPSKPKKRAYHHKMKVLSLVDRAAGQARSVVVDDLKSATVVAILEENIAKKARVLTDEAGHYHLLRDRFAEHSGVRHRKEEYRPGQSGNPRGRPKGSKSIDQVLRQALHRRVPDPRRGGRHTVPMIEIIVEGLVLSAAKRDPRMLRLLLALIDR